MRSARSSPFISAIFFIVLVLSALPGYSQPNSSFYFSVGDNIMSWYGRSNIRIGQGDLGNDYTMHKVKGNNYTHTPFSALGLNYRIGYYYNDRQTWALEVCFDPANYRVIDGQSIHVTGTINNDSNINTHLAFSSKKGYYYYYSGTNLFLLNLVRRFSIYNSNSNKIRFDALAKAGIGPAMTHFVSSLPSAPMSDPQFKLSGGSAAVEGALRATFFRYGFVEVAGRYDYAVLRGLKVYDGTAKQNLRTTELLVSLGLIVPTHKHNPMFRNEWIVTILPFYQQAKQMKEAGNGNGNPNDTSNHDIFTEIPPFQDILDKESKEAEEQYLKLHPPDTFNNADSIARVDSVTRMDSVTHADSIATQDSIEHISDSLNSRKERRHRKHMLREERDSIRNAERQAAIDTAAAKTGEVTDSTKAPAEAAPPAAAPPAAAQEATPPVAPPPDTSGNAAGEEKMSKKEEKRKAKEEKKEAKRKAKEEREKAKEEEKAKKAEEKAAKEKAQEDEDAKKKADQDKADQDKEKADQQQQDKDKADQQQDNNAPPPPSKDGN